LNRLAALGARDDAAYFDGELREIREHLMRSLQLDNSELESRREALATLAGAQTWRLRLDMDLQRVDAAFPRGWRVLAGDTAWLDPMARVAVEQTAFRTARFMAAEPCSLDEARVMAHRAADSIAGGCPETSALVIERVRHAMSAHARATIVAPLVSMLRIDGTASLDDAVAALVPLTLLPPDMAKRLRAEGLTIFPAPGRVDNVPRRPPVGEEVAQRSFGFYDPRGQMIVVQTQPLHIGLARAANPSTPLHEAAHAYEHLIGKCTHVDAPFVAAREADLADGHIHPVEDDYYRVAQPDGSSDPQVETFAQSMAMYLMGDRRWPSLYEYWDRQFKTGQVF